VLNQLTIALPSLLFEYAKFNAIRGARTGWFLSSLSGTASCALNTRSSQRPSCLDASPDTCIDRLPGSSNGATNHAVCAALSTATVTLPSVRVPDGASLPNSIGHSLP